MGIANMNINAFAHPPYKEGYEMLRGMCCWLVVHRNKPHMLLRRITQRTAIWVELNDCRLESPSS